MEFRDLPPERLDFPQMEEDIMGMWEKIDAFKESMRQSKEENRPVFSFYDGPPFATGLPHYGHILAGTLKDTVTRYAHQTGHHVDRRFGWDCHGVPIEFEIDRKLGVTSAADVPAMGIDKYNNECRSIVTRYTKEWERIVTRMGRWIDFENDYKTMNLSFMESVWWVFKQVHEKGLVYRSSRVMPYSTAIATPLSNFEAGQNYKDAHDPAIVITFSVIDDPDGAQLVAWTTTPWTLPSNLALCVNPDFDYVKVQDVKTQKVYILAEALLSELYPKPKKGKASKGKDKGKDSEESSPYVELNRWKGKELVGTKYEPLFPFFKEEMKASAFRVIADHYVTDESGTGVVHCAPAFGEDDMRVCLENGIIEKGGYLPCPIDDDGRFTDKVPQWKGLHVKEADESICKELKTQGKLVSKSSYLHSVPFCYRSETPLIYKAVPSWFIHVEGIKDRLLKNNDETYWVPSHVKEKRFANWLANARDWNVSRNRFWGTPLPVWVSDDGEEHVVVGSVDELEQLSGVRLTDLHREFVDDITIPSKQGKGMLRRTPEVFDCWFESGSMPYAQQHYPFENTEYFNASFPADFVAEGLDQTRGWFYTLMVLSTALFDKPAFKNLVVNGLVLAADGKKMSKRLQNYPDPQTVVQRYGADSLRLYLINSPVMRAEPLNFKESGILDILKDVLLPWYNSYRFFVQNARRWCDTYGVAFDAQGSSENIKQVDNILDRWILTALNSLIGQVHHEMKMYRLYNVVPQMLSFIEQLTNWYVRLNRPRFKSDDKEEDTAKALATLYHVLMSVSILMAPLTPFFAEYVYQHLAAPQVLETKNSASVHFRMLPEFDESLVDPEIERKIFGLQAAIATGRLIRDRRKLIAKQPLRKGIIVCMDQKMIEGLKELEGYLREELNLKELEFTTEETKWCDLSFVPSLGMLGKRLGRDGKTVAELAKTQLADLPLPKVREMFKNGGGQIQFGEPESNLTLLESELVVFRKFRGDKNQYEAAQSIEANRLYPEMMVILDVQEDKSLQQELIAREFVNRVQKLRKSAKLNLTDSVNVFLKVEEVGGGGPLGLEPKPENAAERAQVVQEAFLEMKEAVVEHLLKQPVYEDSMRPPYAVVAGTSVTDVAGARVTVTLAWPCVFFPTSSPDTDDVGRLALISMDVQMVKETAASDVNGDITIPVWDRESPVVLRLGRDFFLEPVP